MSRMGRASTPRCEYVGRLGRRCLLTSGHADAAAGFHDLGYPSHGDIACCIRGAVLFGRYEISVEHRYSSTRGFGRYHLWIAEWFDRVAYDEPRRIAANCRLYVMACLREDVTTASLGLSESTRQEVRDVLRRHDLADMTLDAALDAIRADGVSDGATAAYAALRRARCGRLTLRDGRFHLSRTDAPPAASGRRAKRRVARGGAAKAR